MEPGVQCGIFGHGFLHGLSLRARLEMYHLFRGDVDGQSLDGM